MPSARSASWLNQGLSDTARHFPGLGILAQMPNSAFTAQLGRPSAGSFPDRLRSSKQARARGIDLFGTRKAHEHICLPAHYLAIAR
jgi:hypothetical protein